MVNQRVPFAQSMFPFVATGLAAHRNPVTCLLCGLDRPLTVFAGGERIEGDMLLIRPDIEHRVKVGGRAKVVYFDGMPFPMDVALAARVPAALRSRAIDALEGGENALRELRAHMHRVDVDCAQAIAAAIGDIILDPMTRMSQTELAAKLGMERTRALRAFKAATGMTFRGFKNWTALQAAARQIALGELVRTAALDAGFADTAHLTRAFRSTFGITPTAATADLRR